MGIGSSLGCSSFRDFFKRRSGSGGGPRCTVGGDGTTAGHLEDGRRRTQWSGVEWRGGEGPRNKIGPVGAFRRRSYARGTTS